MTYKSSIIVQEIMSGYFIKDLLRLNGVVRKKGLLGCQ